MGTLDAFLQRPAPNDAGPARRDVAPMVQVRVRPLRSTFTRARLFVWQDPIALEPVELDSVRRLLEGVDQTQSQGKMRPRGSVDPAVRVYSHDAALRSLFKDNTYVGAVNDEFHLVQHDIALYMVHVPSVRSAGCCFRCPAAETALPRAASTSFTSRRFGALRGTVP
jgi:hypothetical protein